jgi:hypothetical protein
MKAVLRCLLGSAAVRGKAPAVGGEVAMIGTPA